MSRELPEWVGKDSDAAIPPRVRVRIFDHYDGRCCCGCNRKIMAGEAWQCDDRIALINGGERRESNLWPLLTEHHKNKTRVDVAIKSQTYKRRARHLGIKKRSSFQTNRDGPLKKRMDGSVVRR
jgi:hypothetical protein